MFNLYLCTDMMKFLLFAFALSFNLNASFQGFSITGKVTDAAGEPLPGVTVMIKGSQQGTVTDTNGAYSLQIPNENTTLTFSFLGFHTQEIVAGNNRIINVSLLEDTRQLEEIVVLGYGAVKKSDLTGSVASVLSKAFLDQPGSSVNSILGGRAPGVVVRRANGAPGQGSTVRIRGANSILGNNDPLYVVDGNYSGGLPNMYDIESIEILKDASATAIYGSQGANGVIIVTTKRGSAEGRNDLKLYSNLSFDYVPYMYDMMDGMEYANFVNEMLVSAGQSPEYSPDYIERIRQEGYTNWQKELFRTGMSQSHKAVWSGGNKKMKYYVSPSFSKMDGIMINTSSRSYGLGSKFDTEMNRFISFQIEGSIGHGETLNSDLGSGNAHSTLPLMSALIWSPLAKVYNDDGTFQVMDPLACRTLNPVLLTTLKDKSYSNNGNAVGNVKIKIFDGLEFNGKAAMSFGTGGSRKFLPKALNGNVATASQNNYERLSWLINSFLTYNKTLIGKHSFSFMLGFEETQWESREFDANAVNLQFESVEWDNLSLGTTNTVGSAYGNTAMRSYFSRGTYNYDGRYYFTGTYRIDGSSKFQGRNRFSNFPSFALAWRPSEEGFLKNTEIFQNLKLRGSWGITGSQAINAYATYAPLRSRTHAWGTEQRYTGYGPGDPSNLNLQWEETTSTDFGLDITTLGGKLSFTFDYYSKQTDKLLSNTTVPLYNGGGTVATNLGTIENKGFEVNLNYVIFENRIWSYDVNLNGARNRNEVVDIGDLERLWGSSGINAMSGSPFIILKGYPLGTLYGYKYLGIWQPEDAAEAAKFGQEPGGYRYEDLNGNNQYDAGDYQVIGCTNPKFTWGFNNHLSWNNWDFNVLFEGLHGRDIMNLTYCSAANVFDNSFTIKSRAGMNRWSPENRNAEFSSIASLSRNNVIMPNSDQWIQDGSYVKLRNISLAYRFTKKMIKVADIRLALSAQNVYTFTKYKGYDPEVSAHGGTDTSGGMDWFTYPNPRSVTMSLTVEF